MSVIQAVADGSGIQLVKRRTHRTYRCVPAGSVARARRVESGEMPESEAIRLAQSGDAGAFERLYQFKVAHGIPTWEQALERMLPALEEAGKR